MGWNINSLVFLLGLPVVGVCATALYLLYYQDDDELEDPISGVKTSRATVLEMKIPKTNVGVVIGRAGSNIKEIEQQSDTKINFKDEQDDDESRTCIIRGSNEGVHLAEAMIHEIIMNQPLIDTFEMWVPQRAVGRIIGRCGESIREISRASNAKVNVDRAGGAGDGEHRIVIKGTSEQIAVAKSLIDEKVEEDAEARRKLEISLASRLPRTKPNKALDMIAANSKNEQVIKTHAFERLVPVSSDGFLEVYVSAVWNPSKFWVQVISPKTVELDQMTDQMTNYYQLEVNRELHEIKEVRVGQIVAAPFDYDDKWYRAEVCEICVDDYDENESKLNLFYVDYGDSGFKKQRDICQLRTDFLKLRFQAIECCLAHVKPIGDVWSEEAIDQFEELSHVALWRPLRAHIVSYKENEREGSPMPCVDLFDTSEAKDIDIGAELVSKGFAVFEENQESLSRDTCPSKSASGKSHSEDLNGTFSGGEHISVVSHDVESKDIAS